MHIPNGQTEHAIETIEDPGAPFFVAVNDNLSVAICFELMAFALQLASELFKIVNLAVEDYPNGFFCIRHRLMPTGEINDRQPPEAQTDRTGNEEAFVVGSAMSN